jgi:hypothetical protein
MLVVIKLQSLLFKILQVEERMCISYFIVYMISRYELSIEVTNSKKWLFI